MAIFLDLYCRLKPIQRRTLDTQLCDQPMPHHFNRALRPLCDVAFSKGTELRNNLFYAILPLLIGNLSIDTLSHLALFVCAIGLWHSAAAFVRARIRSPVNCSEFIIAITSYSTVGFRILCCTSIITLSSDTRISAHSLTLLPLLKKT